MIIKVIYTVDDEATYYLSGEEIQSRVCAELPCQIMLWKGDHRNGGHPEEVGRVVLREISAPGEDDER